MAALNKKITAGRMTIGIRTYGLTPNIRDHVKASIAKTKNNDLQKKRHSDFNYMKLCFKADEVIDKNQGKEVTKWKSKSDILTLLKPLKTKDDSKLPSERTAIESLYLLWHLRERKPVSTDEHVLRMFHDWVNDENVKKSSRGNTQTKNATFQQSK